MPRTGVMPAILVAVLVAAGCAGDEDLSPADLLGDADPDSAASAADPSDDAGPAAPVASEVEPSMSSVADAESVRLPSLGPEPAAALDAEPEPEAVAEPSPEPSESDAPVKPERDTAPAVEPEPEPTTTPEPESEPAVEPAEPEPAVEPPEPEPTVEAQPEPATPTTTPPTSTTTAAIAEQPPTTTTPPVVTTTTTTPPVVTTTTTTPPVVTTTTTTPPVVTTTTTTPPQPAAGVSSMTEPLKRCGQTAWPGRVSALTGTTDRGVYQPIVSGGSDACERIMAWWDEITEAEAQRIANGDYPCEYAAAYSIWPRGLQTNGHPMLVGCWPRLLFLEGERSDDPDQEAARLRHEEGSWIFPPNHPALVEALWNCYRDALQGPPPDWQKTPDGQWPTVQLCHYTLDNYGNPVRYIGVTPDCAASQFLSQIEERKTRGWVGGAQYAGEFSWANCSTTASRLVPPGLDSFTQRCEAVIDASIRPGATDTIAQHHDLTPPAYIAEIKDMYCQGTRANLLNYPQHHGDWVASWLPPEGTLCWHTALLSAAHTAAFGRWTRVKFC